MEKSKRIIQEESIYNHLDVVYGKPVFHQGLAEYLIFYNARRQILGDLINLWY